MDKKSGIYYYLTDNSLRAGGASAFSGIVLMHTTKVPSGLVTVSATDYREKLGYDLEWNNNYAGLDLILSSVATVEVLSLNSNAKLAYQSWSPTGTPTPTENHECATLGEVEANHLGYMWVSHKTAGNWGDRYVGFRKEVGAEYSLHYFSKIDSGFELLGSYTFSIDSGDSNFYKKVDFGELAIGCSAPLASGHLSQAIAGSVTFNSTNLHKLQLGSFGSVNTFDALSIKTRLSAIDHSLANVVVLNGITFDTAIIASIINYCSQQDRSVLIDALTVSNSDHILDAELLVSTWMNELIGIEGGEYAQVAAVPDQITSGGSVIVINPSVFLFQIYAKMYATYGNVNYPPAGPTYGTVTATKLMDSNFALHGDLLKTNRVNYTTKTSLGVCMWEYRTLYKFGNSDLSYASTPFILRDLKSRLLDVMTPFSFRYSSPMDLLTIRSGLSTVLDSFVRNGFLVNYALKVPTYEEAQAAGRTLDIDIAVSVINSMDVINLRVNLRSAADLRAV